MPSSSSPISSPPRPRWRSWALATAAVAATLAVFALYIQPDFMIMLADQMWACF